MDAGELEFVLGQPVADQIGVGLKGVGGRGDDCSRGAQIKRSQLGQLLVGRIGTTGLKTQLIGGIDVALDGVAGAA